MVTECHNIASRMHLKGVSKSPLGACLASMDIGNIDCLALQNLQTPEHSTNRLPKYNLPHLFPDRQRLTSSHPDALRGCGGTGSTQCQPQPLHLLPRSVTRVSSYQNKGTSILWRSHTVKTPGPKISLKPPSSSTATSVVIFDGGPPLMLPSIPFC
eukprot:36938-Pelagomonas_calceolata.AAC.2